MEVSLSELQEVGDELAAASGHRSYSSARVVSRRLQASIVCDERNLISAYLANESLEKTLDEQRKRKR